MEDLKPISAIRYLCPTCIELRDINSFMDKVDEESIDKMYYYKCETCNEKFASECVESGVIYR